MRRIKMLHDRGILPEVDEAIQYPEGIRIRQIDAVTSEPFQAWLVRQLPESMSFASRLRWVEAAWFCLALPLLAWMVRRWTGSWWAGLLGALIYGTCLAGVLRSTGQEISRENFAFPWLMLAYGASAAYLVPSGSDRRVGWAVIAAVSTAFALMSWDMIQYVIAATAIGASAYILIRRADLIPVDGLIWYGGITFAVLLTGLFHPYHRFHGLAVSPLMALLAGNLAAVWYGRRQPRTGDWKQRWGIPLTCIAAPPLLVLALGAMTSYGASYGHFGELLYAKIRFLNEKPADPGLLTYHQRVMWVPALHSATWGLTNWLFPFTLWIGMVIAVTAWFTGRASKDPLLAHVVFLFFLSVAAYVLFVRFHVFVALYAALLTGWALARAGRGGWSWRCAATAVAALVLWVEASHTYAERYNMSRPNVYYEEMTELADWLREHVAPEPVLANIGVSAYIATYGKCPIVLHPKFEDPTIRDRMERFGLLMFGEDEKALRDWMDELGVRYLVYAKGEFAREKPEYQMRYFVNRLNPSDSAPARRFEAEDNDMRYFKRQWGNHKYAVYRTFSAADEQEAKVLAAESMALLEQGHLELAEERALQSVLLDPEQHDALKVLRHVGSLYEQGFQPAPGNEAR